MAHPWGGSRALWILLGILALAPRLVEVASEPAYLHPDALHQALEPAFRAAHGFGEQSWEWREGLRSWLWPGLLAPAFAITRALGLSGPGHGMGLAIALARTSVALVDVAAVLLAARIVAQLVGRVGAVTVVLLSSLHPAAVVMGAQPLIDVPAAAALVWACERAFATDAIDRRRGLWLGLSLGLVLVLRIQLLPAVAVVPVVLAWRRSSRPSSAVWLRVGAGLVGMLLAGGLLDLLTWGRPFASTLAYLQFNLGEGQTAMGVMPADRYWEHAWLALDLLAPLLLVLALVGAVRHPGLGLVWLAVVIPHQLVPYKVWRFLYPAQTLAFVLAVVGAAWLFERLHARGRRAAGAFAAVCGVWALAGCVRASVGERLWETTWLFNQGGQVAVDLGRGLDRAYLELGRREQLQGVVQTVLPRSGAPGLALLGHDVPVIHPLGARVAPEELAGADVWIVRDEPGPGGSGLDPRLRQWHDPDSGVAIYAAPRAANHRSQPPSTVGPSAP